MHSIYLLYCQQCSHKFLISADSLYQLVLPHLRGSCNTMLLSAHPVDPMSQKQVTETSCTERTIIIY